MNYLGNRFLGYGVLLCVLSASAFSASAAEVSLERWVNSQTNRSLDGVYMAISPRDGARGAVMASPSRQNPNYYYHWIRDAALVLREVWAFRSLAPRKAKNTLIDYALFSRSNQTTDNPSGSSTTTGLGEPKFEITGAPYNESWGRPQNDGPALRVLTLLGLADEMMMNGEQDFVYRNLYAAEIPARTVIKADLEYVAHRWRESSFDLWEEVKGDHFYTRIAQWRALYEGALFAKRMNDGAASAFYAQQAAECLKSLDGFWSPSKRILVVTKNQVSAIGQAARFQGGKDSQLDIAIVLGSLHAGKSGMPFYVDDERVISTAHKLVEAFTSVYDLNRTVTTNREGYPMAPGIGRYPEDVYDGYTTNGQGNPWFLTTHAMAEYLLRLRGEVKAKGVVRISDLTRPFYESLLKHSLSSKTVVRRADPVYAEILKGLQDRSDEFLRRSQFHTGAGGHQSEQFNRNNGYMQGARDLTWSYASFLSLRRIREKNHD
jgi:glucoamylase